MDSSFLANLIFLFDIEQVTSFRKCEEFLCQKQFKNFQDFLRYLKICQRSGKCQCSWAAGQLSAHCLDCQRTDDSCICIPCFIAGGHFNHRSYITRGGGTANCDCGDHVYWKKEGFCPNHCGEQHSSIPETLKRALAGIFRASVSNIGFLAIHDYESFNRLLTWLESFVQTGDSVREMVASSLNIALFGRPDFILVMASMTLQSMQRMTDFLGRLSNDSTFRRDFGAGIIKGYPKLALMMVHACTRETRTDVRAMQELVKFCFHAFSPESVTPLVSSGFNWAKTVNDVLLILITGYNAHPEKEFVSSVMLDSHLAYMLLLLEWASECDGQESNENLCAEYFAEQTSLIEGFLAFGSDCEDESETEKYCYNHVVASILARISNHMRKIGAFSLKVFRILFLKLHKLTIVNNFDDSNAAGCINERCVTDQRVRISPQVTTHVFAMNSLLSFGHEITSKFDEICALLNTDRDSLCERFSLLPLRLYISTFLNQEGLFADNVDLSRGLASIFYGQGLILRGAPLFSAIQILYGMSDKEVFVRNIAKALGSETEQQREFWFLWIIGCLVFDRLSMCNDSKQMEAIQAATHLIRRPMSLKELCEEMKMDPRKCHNFIEELSKHSTKSGALFKPKHGSDWHPFHPFVEITTVREAIGAYVSQFPNSCFELPDLHENFFGLDLQNGLLTKTVLAIEWVIMHRSVMNKEKAIDVVHLAVSLMLAAFSISEKDGDPAEAIIRATTVSELAEKIPSSFFEFLHAKVSYEEADATTMIEMLQQTGGIGHVALQRMNIPLTDTLIASRDTMNRERAKDIRRRILSSFAQTPAPPEVANTPDDCPLCSGTRKEHKGYPLLVFERYLPEMMSPEYRTCGALGLRVCPHMIHSDCWKENGKGVCPVDNRRCTTVLTTESNIIDTVFGSFEAALVSLASELCLLEIRHRSRPECLDIESNSILFGEFFKMLCCFWNRERPRIPAFSDPTILLIARLVQNKGSVAQIVSGLSAEPDCDVHSLLRRAAIFERFALGETCDSLALSSLVSRFRCCRLPNDMQLSKFNFVELPSNFLALAMSPYSLEITSERNLALCLITGTVVVLGSDSEKYPSITTHLATRFGKQSSAFLILTGSQATRVVIASADPRLLTFMKGIYVDACEEEDIGLRLGRVLKLSDDRLELLRESFLSGDYKDRVSIPFNF